MLASLRRVLHSKVSELSITRLITTQSVSELGITRPITTHSLSLEPEERPRQLQMHNGQKQQHVFTNEEFHSRITKLRNYMSNEDIHSCLFTSYHNINYYCGFKFCSLGRNFGLVVNHDSCTLITPAVDGGQPWRRSVGCDNVVYTDWYKDNFFYVLKQQLDEVKGKLGLELDVLSVDNFSKLSAVYPGTMKVDIGDPAMRMRVVKSQEEIALIRQGARIAEMGGWAVLEALEDGVTESEVSQHATNTMVKEVTKTFPQSDIMDTWSWVQSGVHTDCAHHPVTARNIHRGDIIVLNNFPMIQGYFSALERTLFLDYVSDEHLYFSALERTLFLDHVSDEHLYVWQFNCDVHKRGLELIKPGVRCCDVVEELNDMHREKGMLEYRTIGYGHSMGSLCHYYGREAALELREDITTVLQPGMVLSMEPMLVVPDGRPGEGGYREHDLLVVTESGNDNLTRNFPLGPEHMVIKK